LSCGKNLPNFSPPARCLTPDSCLTSISDPMSRESYNRAIFPV